MKFKLLLVFFTLNFKLFADQADFSNNQLFLKINQESNNGLDLNSLKSMEFLKQFEILSFEKCFKINTPEFNQIHLLTFEKNTEKIDDLIAFLNRLNLFEYVEKVPIFTYSYTPNDLQSNQWNLYKINAENAWNYSKGNNKIVVAIVDDGLDTAHQDLEPLIWRNKNEIRGNGIDDDGNGYVDDFIGWDFASNDNIPHCGYNTGLEHGTHCAGIVGAKTDNNIGIAGIAYGCQLMITKHGLPFQNVIYNAYQGVEYAIINKANVISMSWGGGGYSKTYQTLFDYAYKQGIVCVAAAGNNYSNLSMYPASYNHVISVGSTSSNDVKSAFSNYGTSIDVMAPGSNIYSTLPNNNYGNMSGTSMACPLAAGLCGLMLSFNPNYSVDEIESCLKNGCDNINSMNSSITGLIGAGRINALKSLRCMKPIIADFESNFKQQCPGDTISFKDLTIKSPSSLLWKFQGGTPNTSTLSNPKIVYSTAGVYDVTLIAYSNLGNDTIVKKSFVTIKKPTAKISLTRNINLGSSTNLKIDFSGNAPFEFTYSDGVTTKTISNVTQNPYFLMVSPVQNTVYTLTSFKDSRCTGTYSGVGIVNINKGVNCNLATRFQATIGGSLDDFAYNVIEDKFGNYAVVGSTKSYGNGDAFLTKWNKDGEMLWFKTYGGNNNELFYNVINTDDNGYLLMGVAASYSSSEDALLIKVDSGGVVQWSKTLGGSSMNEFFYRGVQLENGNFVLGGTYQSAGSGREDCYLIKLDKNGNLIWSKIYGNARYNVITGLAVNKDGSIVFSSSYENPYGELAIMKVDSNGNVLWNKLFGGSEPEAAYDLTIGEDGNIYMVGTYRPTSNNMDMCIASFDQSGNARFVKTFGGSLNDVLFRVKPFNNDLVAVGYSQSYGSGGMDGQIIRFDTSGNVVDQNNFGASSDDILFGINTTQDGGFISVGSTKSFGGGGQDVFINKLNCNLQVGCNEKFETVKFVSNLSANNFTFSLASAGSFTNQSITAVKRSVNYNVICKKLKDENYPCIKTEKYAKISSLTSGFNTRLDNGDQFGQSIKNIGDFDGDGIDDFTSSAQLDDDGGTNLGSFYLILMNSNLSVKSFTKISANQGGFTGNISNDNYFGSNVISINDLDGDGVKELVSGHIYNNSGSTYSGGIWVIFMNSNGTVKNQLLIANGFGGLPNGTLNGGDNFGMNLTNVGDLDKDGIDDIAVGARFDDDGGTDRGAIYFLYLNKNGSVKSFKKISHLSNNFNNALQNGDGFGFSLSSKFDLNGDGYQDIMVGASGVDDGGSGRGGVFILYLDGNQDVISYSKISSTSGNFLGQLDNGDNFGNGVQIIEDLNKDGVVDVLVSAPYDDDGGTDKGAIWILYLTKNGTVKAYNKMSALTQEILKSNLENSDAMGYTVSMLNDIDKNGYQEILIGSMWDDDGGTDRGAVYILSLADTCKGDFCPKTKYFSKVSHSSGNFGTGLDDDDRFGSGVNGIGDLDNDGVNEIAVCADSDDDGNANTGAIWIMFMNSNGTVKNKQKISSTQGNFTGTIYGGTYFGNRIVPLGDLNNDGVEDIAVSNHFDGTVNTRAGCVWILFLNSNGTVKSHQKITTGVGGFSPTLQSDDRFGLGLENIGDFNGDGIVDIAVGAQEDKDGGSSKGAFYLLYLNTNGTVKSHSKISATQGNFTGSVGVNTRFGFSVAKLSDLDTNGTTDLIVSSRDDNDGGTARGALWVLFMNPNGTVKKHVKLSSSVNGYTGLDDYDNLGQDIKNIGDLDNDKVDEVIVSCPWDDDGGSDRGAIYILYLNRNGTIKRKLKVNSVNSGLSNKIDNSDVFGYGIGVLNDIDGNGYKEIIGGAMWDDDGGNNRGAIYIINYLDTCNININLPRCKIYMDFAIEENCVNQTFVFKDLSIDSNKNKINFWEWDFGDGFKQYNSEIVYHTYKNSGVKNIKLRVGTEGKYYCEDSLVKSIFVSDSLKLQLVDSNTICINDSAVLKVKSVYCGVSPFIYEWTPTDGVSNPNVLEPKASPKKSTVYHLKITDGAGQFVIDSTSIFVQTNCCKSYPDFDINAFQFCSYDSIQLTNKSNYKSNATFSWKIKGGSVLSFSGFQPLKFKLINSGNYQITLILKDSCGTDSISKDIVVLPYIKPFAGNDTSICMPDSLLLGTSGLSRNTYEWSPTSGLNNPYISQPKSYLTNSIVYVLKMTDELGCVSYDSIVINNLKSQVLNIGNDTSICEGENLTLKSNVTANQYLWNNNSINNQITVNSQGLYWLEIQSNNCIQRDSITVNVVNLPRFDLGKDTVLCDLTQYEIKANTDISSKLKLWQDGSNSNTLKLNSKGLYWLQVNDGKCYYRDSIQIDFSSKPKRSFNIDTAICEGDTIEIDAFDSLALNYSWSNGTSNSKIKLTQQGKYTVKIKNNCGETNGEITLKHIPSAIVNLGKDTSICVGDTIVLNAYHYLIKKYLWNNNDTNSHILVNKPGLYSVVVDDGCQLISDDKMIDSLVCNCLFYFPNAFSPFRSEHINDVFLPEIESGCEPSTYKLTIYDSWGGEVFTSNNYKEGWNGMKSGKELPVGAYTYIVTMQVAPQYYNKVYQKSGIVILMN